jgi:hypothetical protein
MCGVLYFNFGNKIFKQHKGFFMQENVSNIEVLIYDYLAKHYCPNDDGNELNCIHLSTTEMFSNLFIAFPFAEFTSNLLVSILNNLGFVTTEMGIMQPEWRLYVRTPDLSFKE